MPRLKAFNSTVLQVPDHFPYELVDNEQEANIILVDGMRLDRKYTLKPLINLSHPQHADEFHVSHIQSKRAEIEKICENIAKLPADAVDVGEHDVATFLLAFIWTREHPLELKIASEFELGFGYQFPFKQDELSQHLDYLSFSEYIDRKLENAAYGCQVCGSINVLMREACPKCHSIDVTEESTIHHYGCSYQAPESEFLTPSGQYFCPKCRKDVAHIGLDYDKPGEVTVCHSCHNYFTTEAILGYCVHCQQDYSSEQLQKQFLSSYVITDQGTTALFSNTVHSHNPAMMLNTQLNLINITNFQQTSNYITQLAERYDFDVAITTISLDYGKDDKVVFEQLPTAFYSLGKEISAIVRESDIVCYYENCIYIYLPYTNVEQSRKIYSRLEKRLKETLSKEITTHLQIKSQDAKSKGEADVK